MVHGLNYDELHVTIFVLYVVPVEYITYLVVSASDFIVGIGSLRDERVGQVRVILYLEVAPDLVFRL